MTGSASPTLTEEFTYDKTGNRLIAVLNSSTINYTHNANNELTAAGTIAYLYDQNGNTIQETNGTQITKYIYNSSNRLERVELPDGRIAEYKYDPFGRRISKTISNQTTYYLYADEGLIGEYDSAGNNIKSYGWIPDSIWGTNSIFMQENGNYYFYHNDHLGTPQKMTDETGNVVWSATYTAFGEATIDAGSTITNNLRFAGQYFDEETGKHYNWNRYYDPKTGRYTQVDPIGFEAGDVNLYRYVFNLPINFVDPFGLASGDWWDPRSYTDRALMKRAKEQYAEGHKIAAFIDVMGASLACLAECMAVKSGILDIPVILSPLGAHALMYGMERLTNRIANPLAKAVRVAPSLSKFMYYNMVSIPRLTFTLKLGGKVIGLAGWGYFAYETYECIKECKNKKHCNEGKE